MKTISFKDFADLVCKMRAAQRQYSRTRSYADHINSKIWESQVDNALRALSAPNDQLSFFQTDS